MVEWLFIALCGLVGCFSFVLLFGAPYLPTLAPQVDEALNLLDLAPGQTVLELGCGDGKILVAAAQRGLQAVGYELNPVLALIAWLRTRRYHNQVTVVYGNFWHADWPPADAIFVFLLDKFMPRLDTKIKNLAQPIKLISFVFKIPGKQPVTQRRGLFLYTYSGEKI